MRIKRILAAASAVAALAAAAIAGPAAAAPSDTVLMNAGNVGFGTSFSGHKVTSGGTLDWRQSGSDTDPQLSGTLFIENSTDTYRVAITCQRSSSHRSAERIDASQDHRSPSWTEISSSQNVPITRSIIGTDAE